MSSAKEEILGRIRRANASVGESVREAEYASGAARVQADEQRGS